MLAALDRGNLFLIPLDDRRQWYRYHHLFADVLQARLLDEQPGQLPGLHRRASAWYERSGEQAEAIRHALAAGDVGRAAGLVELAIPAMRRSRQEAAVRGWLDDIPDELVRVRPVLSVAFAGALLARGELEGVEAGSGTPNGAWTRRRTGAGSGPRRRTWPPTATKSFAASRRGSRCSVPPWPWPGRSARHHAARPAGARFAPADDHLVRAGAAGMSGLAFWTSGILRQGTRRTPNAWRACGGPGTLPISSGARSRWRTSGWRKAVSVRRCAPTSRPWSSRRARRASPAGNGRHARRDERGPLRARRPAGRRAAVAAQPGAGRAHRAAAEPVPLAGRDGPDTPGEGDLDGALDLLNEAERQYVGDYFPNVRPVPALKARVWIAQGRLGEALGWAREQGLSADDDLSYLREFEHITLARVLLARYQDERAERSVQEATRLLERLLRAAEEGGQDGTRHRDPGAAGARAPGAR